MKKNLFFSSVLTVLIFLGTDTILAQTAPNLGQAYSYVLFNRTGQFTCSSPSAIVAGDVGNEVGAITAFPPGFLSGDKHFHDATATLVGNDISAAYADLAGKTCGVPSHAPAFGNGETLAPGVYCSTAASTLNGNIILDASSNPAAIFIFKIDGAFSSTSGAQVVLVNGAASCNVFWQINGAVTLINTVFKGTMIADGAINLNTGTIVDGRVLALAGDLIFGSVITTICDASTLPLHLINFDVTKTTGNNVQVSWITASEVNVSRYEVEASLNGVAFYKVGTLASKENSYPTKYSLQDISANKTGVRFYRLKMIDKDGSFSYSVIKSIKFSDLKSGVINIFPNPAANTLNITVNSETAGNVTLTISNLQGQTIMKKTQMIEKGINNITEDVHNLSRGTYILSIKDIKTAEETRKNFQKL